MITDLLSKQQIFLPKSKAIGLEFRWKFTSLDNKLLYLEIIETIEKSKSFKKSKV